MSLMRIIVWMAAIILLGFLSAQLYRIYVNNDQLAKKLEAVNMEVKKLEKEGEELQTDIGYYAEPENLAKELKSKFDYKKPGEKLIKIQ